MGNNGNNIPCIGGGSVTLQVVNNDCNCVGIASIVNNQPASNTFTITLTNGQSITLPLIPGASGTIAMQVAGAPPYIQYSANGGPWINLISIAAITGPPGANGSNLIWSDPLDHTTVNGSATVLSTFNTNSANPAENLVNVGDVIRLKAIVEFDQSIAHNANTPENGITINGTGLAFVLLNTAYDMPPIETIGGLEFYTDIILSDNTAGNMTCRIISWVKARGLSQGVISNPQFFPQLNTATDILYVVSDIGGATVDFSANNYTVDFNATDSNKPGATILKYFSAEKLSYGAGSGFSSVGTSFSAIPQFLGGLTTYTFNGVVTAYNPNGIDLRGLPASKVNVLYNGVLKSQITTPADYTFTSGTGAIAFAAPTVNTDAIQILVG